MEKKLILSGSTDCNIIFKYLQKAVCIDHRNLEKFASILCQFDATVRVGNAIMDDYSKY